MMLQIYDILNSLKSRSAIFPSYCVSTFLSWVSRMDRTMWI